MKQLAGWGSGVRLTVRNKLYAALGAIALMTMVLAVLSYSSLSSVDSAAGEAVDVGARLEAIGFEIEAANLEARRREKDFFLEFSALGIETAYEENVPDMQAAVARVQALATEGEGLAQTEAEAAVFDNIHQAADTYETELLNTLELVRVRGFVDTGAEGDLRAAVHEIEVMFDATAELELDPEQITAVDKATITMLGLRRNEKDYLLRGSDKYIERAPGMIESLKGQIVGLPLTPDQRSAGLAAADTYLVAFNALVQADVDIASSIEVYKAATHDIGTFSGEILAAGSAAREASVTSLGNTVSSSRALVLGIAGAALMIAAGAGFWLVRSLAPLNQVQRAAEGIAEGDLKQTLEIHSSDEIGDLAGSMREMIVYLEGMSGAAGQIAVGDLKIDVTPKSENDALGHAFVGMKGYLNEMVGHAGRIADGDLTVKVTTRSDDDALANAFDTMVSNLRTVLGETQSAANALTEAKEQLADIAEQASTATQEVATTVGQVAEGSADQARRVQDVNSAVEQLNRSADELDRQAREEVATAASRVASGSSEASDESKGASERAERGAQMVEQTVEGIERIKTTIDSASQEITVLGERSQEIGKIVAVIEDIAAQTNLLALNAAIEAARAGEQGRGFAVVADEVRQLAERVAGATKEIAALIGGVQEGVDSSVKVMEEGVKEMETGTQSAAEARGALQEILSAVSTVGSRIDEIAGAAGQLEQASESMVNVIGEVKGIADTATESVAGIASVAEENSASTEEVSASAEEMSAQVEEVTASTLELGRVAERLQEQLSTFDLGDQHGSGASEASRASGEDEQELAA